MKLAISNHGLRNSGGIERYAMTIVRGLHARGVRPALIAKVFDTALPEYDFVDPLHASVRFVPGKLRDLAFDWRIGRLKRRLGLFPLIACNQTRWSDIGICGSTHPGFLEAMDQRARRSDGWKIALERAHLEGSKVVVAHSAKMRGEVLRFYGVDAAKIELLYPPIDGDQFSPVDDGARAALRRELGMPDDRAVFLLASTGHRRKGLDLLARVFAETSLPATLVVAGRAPDTALPNVRYLGYRTDIENAYRAADFTVMASHYEPFGLVGVESVLCGTPVLLAEGVGCAEVIRAPGAIPFALGDPAALPAAVATAVQRWQAGSHRLASPRDALGYDPSVDVHVGALLAIAARLSGR
ncbi:MAG TPA: glycosyltransferase family 4 protein [Burkholderiaceae bacterium]|jgi:glycosyltransferase involved in cell wall biosynthesis